MNSDNFTLLVLWMVVLFNLCVDVIIDENTKTRIDNLEKKVYILEHSSE